MLREIKKPIRDHALRILQCLVAAIRPLSVEELAEVLAVDFDDAGGVPKLKPNWRWEDQEQALLISCSNLITIVDTGRSRVVQFSHFSVKEFLTSERLATSSQDVSRYHIALNPAHTILAQACMSILLHVHDHDEQNDVEMNDPLALYAAEYWVRHAQFEDVALQIKGMEYLFDADKPYFAAWCKLHDIDIFSPNSVFSSFPKLYRKSAGTPLYYAALCGFRNIVEQLIVKHPKDVRAISGYLMTPAVAALAGRHFEVAQVLHRRGSSMNPQGSLGKFPLHCAVDFMDLEMIQVLVDHGAGVNVRNKRGSTPLGYALRNHRSRRPANPGVVRWLLNHGADPNVRDEDGETSLHKALESGMIEIARILVEHGASVKVEDRWGWTPLDYASGEERDELIKLHYAKRENCYIM